MILVSHPTGNANVRNVLWGLERAGMLHSFQTTLAFDAQDPVVRMAPAGLRAELLRRSYHLPPFKIERRPLREFVRLLAPKLRCSALLEHESGWASVDAVYQDLDRAVSNKLARFVSEAHQLKAVYCYEDGALQTFRVAKELGLKCVYDQPTPYWELKQGLLAEEANRYPDWKGTMGGIRDSAEKLARKTEELKLSDMIVCASPFTLSSIPSQMIQGKPCIITPYGIPGIIPEAATKEPLVGSNRPLRLLFVASLTQAKGLADLFAAMKLADRPDVELVVLGSLRAPMDFYRQAFSNFTYLPPRPNAEVLQVMQSCDVFVFPSLYEGRGLVQLEAMACGLPLISTINATGEDLVDEGETGFIVPIRSPEKLAEKINWFADNRHLVEEMGAKARLKAKNWTWENYQSAIVNSLRTV